MNDLFSPFRLGALDLPNRLVRSATHARMAESDGRMSAAEVELYRRLSAGGVGLIVSGHMYVRRDGICSLRMLGADRDDHIPALAAAARAVHGAGPARLIGQLNYGGANVNAALPPTALLASSFRADVPAARPAAAAELEELAAAYGRAARRLREAGFDGAQLHAAHGYFINQTLSPLFNRRDDEFGGSAERRRFFLRRAIEETRREAGADFPLLLKLVSEDGLPGGLDLAEAAEAAKMAEELGVCGVEVSGGARRAMNARRPGADPDCPFFEGYFAAAARSIRAVLGVPVISVGGYRSLAAMRGALAEGAADLVALSRPLIRDPELPAELAAGAAAGDCSSCNLCQVHDADPLRCWARPFDSATRR